MSGIAQPDDLPGVRSGIGSDKQRPAPVGVEGDPPIFVPDPGPDAVDLRGDLHRDPPDLTQQAVGIERLLSVRRGGVEDGQECERCDTDQPTTQRSNLFHE
jgi:hypothetical protein